MDDDNLPREEVRGIFVLGVIGSLLAIESLLRGVKITPNLTLHTVSYLLTGYWGLYVFLMTIGVSPDLIQERVSSACRNFAKIYFIYGIGAIISLPIMILFDYYITSPYKLSLGIDLILVFCVASLLYRKLRSDRAY